jgi:hypothetical protein
MKMILGLFISLLTSFINIKEKGFKSWKTIFSLFSLSFLVFYGSLLFDDNWKIFIYEKLNSYLIIISIFICIILSFFSHEYLYMLDINIIDNIKTELFKFKKSEFTYKPDIMKIEDLLNKGDNKDSNHKEVMSNIGLKKIKIEDLLNKEDLINTNDSQNSSNKIGSVLNSLNKKGNINDKVINNLAELNKDKNFKDILFKGNANIDINDRPNTSNSIGSVSVMSHDSTISNAHISIIDGTRQLTETAELFTNQWKEGKILSEDAKEKKELLDEIMDLPDKKVFNVMKWRLNWECNSALLKFVRKRNMPYVPEDRLIEMVKAGFNETMSNKEEKQKFWNRLKVYVKEPVKDKNDLLEKLRKETLGLYIKGEEEPIRTGENKKNVLELGGRKLKKGGLITVYEDKKIDAETTLQQEEINAMKKGIEIKRILPSFGRLSIFEVMNQSVGSIINDFKKLNIDSSSVGNANNDVKTNSINIKSNLKDEGNINNINSPTIENKDLKEGKSLLIKGDNNELNKKRRIN